MIDARRVALERIASDVTELIRGGGVVIFPTDTVYGIGCSPHDARAVDRIFSLKNRPRTKPLALHLADAEAFLAYAGDNPRACALAHHFLPGPLTVIVRRPPSIGPDVTAGMATLGLRIPDHPLCRAILRGAGALAATSANRSGERAYVGGSERGGLPDADLLIDDGATPLETESTVIDVSRSPARIVRAGAVPAALLEKVLGSDLQ